MPADPSIPLLYTRCLPYDNSHCIVYWQHIPDVCLLLSTRHALNITDAPEPSDVQYENIEHSTFERFIRAFLVSCCSYTCLAAGFALISLASAMRLNLSKVRPHNSQAHCTLCKSPLIAEDPHA